MPSDSPTRRTHVLVADCIHEVCSFTPVPTRYDDFLVHRGDRILAYHRGIGSEVAGAPFVFAGRSGVEVIPTFGARGITSGGAIPAADFARITDEFLGDLRGAGPADAAYFALHRAMAADGEDDPEGFLFAEARKILGEEIREPIHRRTGPGVLQRRLRRRRPRPRPA